MLHYLLVIVCPPLAVLVCQKPAQALLNLILTLCFWVPGMLHAFVVVRNHRAEKRAIDLVDQMQQHRISWALKRL